MRIRHLELEGFRGFCGREQFDLDADAVIISGANGRGKTSFLDAILWCLTGQLPRIGETADVVSLYSTTGEARVEITLGTRVSADAFSITRSCDRAGTVRVSAKDSSGWEGKGEEAEVAIRRRLWPAALESGGGPEAVAKAFTRSVYLEQDLIRQYLESDSDDERFAILSEIVGVGRITELQHYLATAKRAWSRGTTQVREEGKQWATEVQKLSAELERLGSITDSGQHIQSWETWWRSVAQRIDVPSPPGVSAEAKSHLEQALQALEEIQTQAKRRVARLVRLKGDLEELPPFDEAGYASLLAKIDAVEHDLYAAREALSVAQSEADTRRAALVREKEEAADLAALAEIALRHLGDNCPVCTQPYNEQQTRHHLNTLLTTRPRDPAEADDESHSGVEEALAVVEGLSSEFESLRQQTGDLEVHRRTRADAIERIESASEELGLEPSRYGDLNEKAVSGELQLAEDTLRETRTLIGQGE